MKKIRIVTFNLSVLIFLFSRITAQNYFDEMHIINNSYHSPSAFTSVDFDFDGDIDIVTGNWTDSIAWFSNNGDGTFDDPVLISNVLDNVKSVFVCDIDLDGDYDIFSASTNDKTIAWIENYDNYSFSTPNIITQSIEYAKFVAAYDMDNDGDIDVIGSGSEKIVWYENDGNSNFINPRIIEDENGSGRILCFSDFDNDGDFDILSTNIIQSTKQLIWYKNNGDRTFTKQFVDIPVDYEFTRYIDVFDLDGDQKDDFILSVNQDYWGKVLIFRNTGNGNFEFIQALGIERAISFTSGDFDNDGDGDIIIYSDWDNNITFAENKEMSFSTTVIKDESVTFFITLNKADIDNDNDLDILISLNNGFFWIKNYLLEIQQQPENSTVCVHEPTTFSVEAKDATSYRWEVYGYNGTFYFKTIEEYNNEDFENFTTNVLTIFDPTIELDSLLFRCKIKSYGKSMYSDTVVLNIFKDDEPPLLKTKNYVLYLKDGAKTEIPAAYSVDELSDNCGYIDTTLSKSAFDCSDIGENTIQVTAVDGYGNAVSEYATITVKDTVSPVITFHPEITKFFSMSDDYKIKSDYADPDLLYDNCGIYSVTNSVTGGYTLEGAILPLGTTTVEWTVTDISGNSRMVTSEVLVTKDNEYLIYPNPFNYYVAITQKIKGYYDLEIINTTGLTVYKITNISEMTFYLGLGFLTKGVYFVRIITDDNITNLKIIKVAQ